MINIDVRDLPEPIARTIAVVVETIRRQIAKEKLDDQGPGRPAILPQWPGQIIGDLRRAKIYDSV
jgi:hypothetical protein